MGTPLTPHRQPLPPARAPADGAGALSWVPGLEAWPRGRRESTRPGAAGPGKGASEPRAGTRTYRVPQERAHVTWREPIHQLRPFQQRRVRPRPALGLDQAHVPVLGRDRRSLLQGEELLGFHSAGNRLFPCPDQRAVAADCWLWFCNRDPDGQADGSQPEAALKACSEPIQTPMPFLTRRMATVRHTR